MGERKGAPRGERRKGRCSLCLREVALTLTGRVYPHAARVALTHNGRCRGSGSQPLDMAPRPTVQTMGGDTGEDDVGDQAWSTLVAYFGNGQIEPLTCPAPTPRAP
jgi:hypothetical protein